MLKPGRWLLLSALFAACAVSAADAAPRRPVPEALREFENDLLRAANCMGPITSDVDFEQVAETTFLSGPAQIRTIYKLQRPGLHVETLAARGSRREGGALTGLFGRWENTITFTSNDWEDNIEKAVRTSAIECSGPLFPLVPGKSIDYSKVVSHLWLISPKLVRTHGFEVGTKVRMEIVDGPLSAPAVAQRFPKLKLAEGTQQWKVYAVRNTSTREYLAYDPTESTPENVTRTCEGVFIEGPNHYLCPDDYAKEGWTLTLKQLP